MDGGKVQFRQMTVEDLEQVMEVEHAVFTTPWSLNAFLNELINNHFAQYIVAELDNKVIGYCGVWVILDEAHITNVAIDPDYQGRKIGYKLMQEIMTLSKERGAKKMTLEVRKSNHVAQFLYQKLGFENHGIRKGYYTDNHEDAIIMWVNLDESSGDSSEESRGGRPSEDSIRVLSEESRGDHTSEDSIGDSRGGRPSEDSRGDHSIEGSSEESSGDSRGGHPSAEPSAE